LITWQRLFRIAIVSLLTYFIYRETGPITAFVIMLNFLWLEVHEYLVVMHTAILKDVTDKTVVLRSGFKIDDDGDEETNSSG